MKIFLLLLLAWLVSPSQAQTVNWNWGRQVGGTGADYAGNTVIDASGNTIQVGEFRNSITFGSTTLTSPGSSALYMVKYTSQGQLVWARQAGNAPAQGSSIGGAGGMSLTTDQSGNIYVIGGFNGTVTFGSTTLIAQTGPAFSAFNGFVCKYSSAGNPIWAVLQGGSYRTDATDVAVDNISGNVVVTGTYTSTATFENITLTSQGDSDMFVAKYTNQGSLIWARSVGGAFQDYSTGLAIDNQSNIYLTGAIHNSATVGSITVLGFGSADALIAKLDAQGIVLWANLFGGAGYDDTAGITLANNGDFFLVGGFEQSVAFSAITLVSQGAQDGFVLRGTPQGNVVWAKQFSGPGDEAFSHVQLGGNGGLYLAGGFSSATSSFGNRTFACAGGYDAILVRCDTNGNFVWGERGGGAFDDIPVGLACDATGGISMGCYFIGSTQYGPFSFTSRGAADAVLLHLQDNTVTAARPALAYRELSVYPNPATSTTLVTLKLSAASLNKSSTIEIVNGVGCVVRRYQNSSSDNQLRMDLTGCSPGVYTIAYKDAENFSAKKLILE